MPRNVCYQIFYFFIIYPLLIHEISNPQRQPLIGVRIKRCSENLAANLQETTPSGHILEKRAASPKRKRAHFFYFEGTHFFRATLMLKGLK